ncbi:MAG TPA: TadE/TadG family type IV pilus assembly protein [Acidimicrobiia bacterium]|nr:TadE/TadG family type IV pilus assembly protein [Acidimicrobiia bacterium]
MESVMGGCSVWFNKGRANDRGASLIEFAVVAPLLFLLLFGVIEFARLGHGFTTVWTSAREGARYATTVGDNDSDGLPNYLDCASITEAALDKVIGMSLATSDVGITFSDLTGAPVADCDPATPLPAPSPSGSTDIDNGFGIEVEVEGTFNAIVPLLSSFLDGIDLTSSQNRSVFKGVVGE